MSVCQSFSIKSQEISCNASKLWDNTGMKKTATRTSIQSIDSLARLLASENITIQHQPVATAAFDTLSRTLILPIWEDMTQEVYDMLVGHEVGHALFTPAGCEELDIAMSHINEETGANLGLIKTTLNIIEDARIERMMKDKYPGLRRDFVRGYKWLHGRDFFGLNDTDVEKLTILDRINLHYKLGTIDISIPFNAIEQVFIQKIDVIESWEDVVEMTVEVLSFYKDNRPEENEENDPQGGAGTGQPGDSDENGCGQSGDDGFEDDSDDSSNGAGQAASDDGEDVGSGDESGEGNEETGDCGASMEDDTDDGESADSTASDEASEGLSTDGGWGNELDSRTENSLADNLAKQANTQAKSRQYIKNPNMLLDNIIITHKEIADIWTNKSGANFDGADRLRKQWERANMPIINNMAKQFEMKKSADEARRTFSSKTGRLDMNRLHAYKTSDDIFLSAENMRDGKNHGLVMFIDWSGSMHDNLAATCSQLLNLIYFCKKANVPFEVYAFTSVIGMSNRWNMTDEEIEAAKQEEETLMNLDSDEVQVDKFRLLQFFTNEMNSRQFRVAVQQMMILMGSYIGRGGNPEEMFNMDSHAVTEAITQNRLPNKQLVPSSLQLGCTPLNEAILAAKDIVNNFKSNNNVQICNTVFLTDGEASSRFSRKNGNYGETLVMRHRRKEFELDGRYGNVTNAMLRWLEATTDCNVMGFFICGWQDFRRACSWGTMGECDYDQQQEMLKEYKKDGFRIMPNHPGYDEFYAINMNPTTRKSVGFDDLDSNASLTRIKNAFVKAGNTKKSNRKIMVRFAEIFATNKG